MLADHTSTNSVTFARSQPLIRHHLYSSSDGPDRDPTLAVLNYRHLHTFELRHERKIDEQQNMLGETDSPQLLHISLQVGPPPSSPDSHGAPWTTQGC